MKFNPIAFFSKPIFQDKRFLLAIFILFSFGAAVQQLLLGKINNYYIFKYVFYHLIENKDLYKLYPNQYFDSNHYGPFFGLVISPFAILPDWLGAILWNLFNMLMLFFAIAKLPLTNKQQAIVYWIILIEFTTAAQNLQSNSLMASLFIFSFLMFENKKPFWAAFFIAFGGFIKLYPFLGAIFFLLYPDKLKFVGSMIFWSVVFFALPMVVISFHALLNHYYQFYLSLAEKVVIHHEISFLGLLKYNIYSDIPTYFVILVGFIILISVLIKPKKVKNRVFRMLFLSAVLIWTVIFSPGAESPTYIIAVSGIAIWFVLSKKNKLNIGLLLFAFVLTILSPTDIFPHYIRHHIIEEYALKALPVTIIWFKIIYQLFSNESIKDYG
jgi:MFS family permease